ncbi:MAG: PaaI family thioesterase [Methanomicrobiales archaeon]|nr:PaaI family thioesterase [Methanomicrobiales archaeon]
MPEKITRAFDACEYAQLMGMRLQRAEGGIVSVEMDPGGKRNPAGVIHGGAVFALADQAFGIAANLGPVPQVAVSASIQYLAPATGTLTAVAARVADTPATSLYRVEVWEEERLVAVFHGTGYKIRKNGG